MSHGTHEIVAGGLLALAVLVQWLCCLGMLRTRRVYDRLHFLGPTSLLVGPLIALAVVADGTSVQAMAKAVILALILAITGPVSSHALARAVRVRETGEAKATPAEIRRGAPPA